MKLSAICETKFHYQDKIRPIDYVVNLSLNMQVFVIFFQMNLVYIMWYKFLFLLFLFFR